MAFDPKPLMKTPAFAIAGGIVIGMGVIRLIEAFVSMFVNPVLGALGSGILSMGNLSFHFWPFFIALIAGAGAAIIGLMMIKAASKE